jgi:hypothetical protein
MNDVIIRRNTFSYRWAGFIGSAIVSALNPLDLDNIIIHERLSNDDRYKNLIPLHFRDYVDWDELFCCLKEPEEIDIKKIFYLGASAHMIEIDDYFLTKITLNSRKILRSTSLRTLFVWCMLPLRRPTAMTNGEWTTTKSI